MGVRSGVVLAEPRLFACCYSTVVAGGRQGSQQSSVFCAIHTAIHTRTSNNPPPIHRPLYTVHPLSPPASQSLPPRAPAPSTARCFRRRDLLLPRRDANPHALRKHGALVTGPPPLALSETPV